MNSPLLVPYSREQKMRAVAAMLNLYELERSLKAAPKPIRELEGKMLRLVKRVLQPIIDLVSNRFRSETWSDIRAVQASNVILTNRGALMNAALAQAEVAAQYGKNRIVGQVQSLSGKGKGLVHGPLGPEDRGVVRGVISSEVDKLIGRLQAAVMLPGLTNEKWKWETQKALNRFSREATSRSRSEMEFAYAVRLDDATVVQWEDSDDERVRRSHRGVNGERRRIGEKFSNGCRYPKDPLAPSEERDGCRCRLKVVS